MLSLVFYHRSTIIPCKHLGNSSQSPVGQRCGPGYQERDTPTDEQQYTCDERGSAAARGYGGMPEDQETEEYP